MTDYQTSKALAVSSSVPTLDARYVRRLMPDPSGGFTATIHELPGCIAEGDTAEEALEQLESVAHSWMESATANGYPITPPIDYEGASGKIALRISRRLHQLAAERAALEGTSLNQFIGNAVASYLGQQDGMRRLAKQLEHALESNMHTFYVTLYDTRIRREASSVRTFIGRTDFLSLGSSTDQLLFVTPTAYQKLPIQHYGQDS
jgi:predicted RNase H-like HicB family nuclease